MRQIPIFVSSTFSDMHRERDLLHQIEGLINRDLLQTGYQIDLRDLRYGIDTAGMDDETEIEKKILRECFDTINECALFVLLLGDRYGSVFEDLTIPRLYMPDRQLEGKSVTHLELEYGALQIEKSRIMVFTREFSGDLSHIPPQYRESSEGMVRNKGLKEFLSAEDYYISPYSAHMKDGVFTIDEDVFVKHAQGFLEQMVLDYIKQQPPLSSGEALHLEAKNSESMNEALFRELQNKANAYPENLRKTARSLMLLRIQELLHRDDYDEINRRGAGGKVIQEYRMELIRALPDDFVGLLRNVCRCISAVVESRPDVFGLLQILAYAQTTELSQMGGISLYEMLLFSKGERFPHEQTCDEWLDSRCESSGIHRQQLPEQKALACFLGKRVLLTHTEAGYLLADSKVITLLAETCPAQVREQIWENVASVFWYLPNPVQAWVHMLRDEKYGLCLSCLEYIRLDDRFAEELLDYIANREQAEILFRFLTKLSCWMIDHSVEEAYILYLLILSRQLANRFDGLESEELFGRNVVPLYQGCYERFYRKHCGSLTISQQYFLCYLFVEFELELPEPPKQLLSPRQTEKTEAYTNAIWELFMDHDLADDEDMNGFLTMVNILNMYAEQPDQLVRTLRMYAVQGQPSWGCLCKNLTLLAMENCVLRTEDLIPFLTAAMHIHCSDECVMSAIEGIAENVAETAYALKETDLCISALHLLYDLVCAETRSRRCEWYRWSMLVSCDLISEVWPTTKDAVVAEIASVHDDFPSASFEELSEIDESILQKAKNRYTDPNGD